MAHTLPIMMSLFGTAYSASASIRAGNAEADLANYNAGVAEANAQASDYRAKDAIERGAIDEATHRTQVKQLIGRQRTALAAQGQDLASGSALDVQVDTAKQAEPDALTIRANAAREAWGYKMTGFNERSQAVDLRAQGQIAKARGRNAAVQTILTDGTKLLYQKYGSQP